MSSHQPYLSKLVVAAYSCGHFLNDATASCWFSYLLLYLQDVRGLSGVEAGAVLFSGQIADAIATPIAGFLSDRGGACARLGFGRRKFWNFVGVCTVIVSFYFLFAVCVACDVDPGASVVGKAATFALAASIFNVGWAFVQVSHMALVPDLTPHEDERVLLNSARYGATVLASLFVFVTMLGILGSDGSGPQSESLLETAYTHLTWIVLCIGSFASLLFLVGTPEKADAGGNYGMVVDDEEAPLTSSLPIEPGSASKRNSNNNTSSSNSKTNSFSAAGAAAADHSHGAEPFGSGSASGGGRTSSLEHSHEHGHLAGPGAWGGLSHHDEPLYAPPSMDAAGGGGVAPVQLLDADEDEDEDDAGRLGPPRLHMGGSSSNSNSNRHPNGSNSNSNGGNGIMTWRDWLRQPAFWVVAMVYMLTRLATNVSQVYLSIYVRSALHMAPTAIATVPLLVFIASLLATLGMKRLSARLGWLWAFTAGAAAMAVACGGMLLASPASSWLVYPSALALGAGVAVVSVLSVTAEADLIGTYTESGAFVYGAISLTDKMSNGAAVLSIQYYGDRIHEPDAHGNYVRYVNSLVPLFSIIAAVLVATRLASQPPPRPSSSHAIMSPSASSSATSGNSNGNNNSSDAAPSPGAYRGATARSRSAVSAVGAVVKGSATVTVAAASEDAATVRKRGGLASTGSYFKSKAAAGDSSSSNSSWSGGLAALGFQAASGGDISHSRDTADSVGIGNGGGGGTAGLSLLDHDHHSSYADLLPRGTRGESS